MATQIDSRTNETSVLTPETSSNESSVLTQEKVQEIVLSEDALAAAEEILRSRPQVKSVGPLALFCNWLIALPGELAGRPMSDKERIEFQLSRGTHERQGGAMMWW